MYLRIFLFMQFFFVIAAYMRLNYPLFGLAVLKKYKQEGNENVVAANMHAKGQKVSTIKYTSLPCLEFSIEKNASCPYNHVENTAVPSRITHPQTHHRSHSSSLCVKANFV